MGRNWPFMQIIINLFDINMTRKDYGKYCQLSLNKKAARMMWDIKKDATRIYETGLHLYEL